jgi:hypothetical protein
MYRKEIDLSLLFQTTWEFDQRLFGTLGTCTLFGGAIEIDIDIKSSVIQEAVLEHEITHRADLNVTHFGNLYNLIKIALASIESFNLLRRKQVQELSNYFIGSRFAICFEGRATFNERIGLLDITEDAWLKHLRNRNDQTYYDGYILASRIMKMFSIEKEIVPYLSDVLLTLPLCIDWYDHFSTIKSACEYVRSLSNEDWPAGRLNKLTACLDEIILCNPEIITEFCREVNENCKDVYTKALSKRVEEVTPLRDIFIISPKVPTGSEVSYFLRELMTKYLRKPLLNCGFAYADHGNVPEINRILNCWNRDIEVGKCTIPEFRTGTALSAQYLNIQFAPLGKKRAVYPIRPEKIKDRVQSLFQRQGKTYCLARLHQVWEESGWEVAKDIVLPFGAWYFVLAIRYSDLQGQGVFYVTPPDFAGVVRFSQFYHYFTSAEKLIDEFPVDLPRTLWLLPSPNAYRYSLLPSLRKDLLRVIEQVEMNMGRESDCYCVLAENSIDEILRELVCSSPTRCLYNDQSDLWRLWRAEGLRKRLFFTPKIRSMHDLLRELLESRGIRCEVDISPHDDYLFEWLVSGEGF